VCLGCWWSFSCPGAVCRGCAVKDDGLGGGGSSGHVGILAGYVISLFMMIINILKKQRIRCQ
jgi:hypothetical protein